MELELLLLDILRMEVLMEAVIQVELLFLLLQVAENGETVLLVVVQVIVSIVEVLGDTAIQKTGNAILAIRQVAGSVQDVEVKVDIIFKK